MNTEPHDTLQSKALCSALLVVNTPRNNTELDGWFIACEIDQRYGDGVLSIPSNTLVDDSLKEWLEPFHVQVFVVVVAELLETYRQARTGSQKLPVSLKIVCLKELFTVQPEINRFSDGIDSTCRVSRVALNEVVDESLHILVAKLVDGVHASIVERIDAGSLMAEFAQMPGIDVHRSSSHNSPCQNTCAPTGARLINTIHILYHNL